MSLPFGSFLNQRDVRETKNINLKQMDTALDMGSHRIINVTNPTDNQDASTKKYVDDNIGIKADTTYYWSAAGSSFNGSDTAVSISSGLVQGYQTANSSSSVGWIHVNLPDGATITEVKCWGSGNATWKLIRNYTGGTTAQEMASGSFGTADTTIYYATIDNENYDYYMNIDYDAGGDDLYMARIKYTL